MPENEQPTLPVQHLNNGLFADYYLNEIMPKLPEWDAAFEAGKACFEQMKHLRATLQPETLDEAQLEESWIRPVLRLLGHHYAVQGKIRFLKSYRKPDYVFLATQTEALAVTDRVYEPHQITNWRAVGDAKYWGAKLDQPQQGERSPSQQIDEYLRYSERPWGILTDGRYWRLYQRETSKNNQYYAVDLDNLLENDNISSFLYFYAFFRLEAFTTGWLEKVLSGSEDFAQRLTDKLENEVFDALEIIAQGFLDYRRNRLSADAPTLRTIYEQSLVLLYRLLFIFYAESREILPLNQNGEYTRSRSLQAIKRSAATALDFAHTLNPDSGDTYNRLRDLFFAIDAGDAKLDLPPYNGRLFSDTEHPFLERNVVGDAHLIPALDKLARVEDGGRRVYVDYRDLEVRHLGSIYEKLLEYELDVATVPLTTQGQEERYAPALVGERVVKDIGQVYLRTGSNERKVTGSYYTPDYIVRFIVEKTLEPLLTDITTRHTDLNEDGSWRVREGEAEALVEEVLALNVLDPATGSGHFVVDVTAYIAEWMRKLGMRPADLGDEDELIYWKRQVASACIYALDINPLAVELAKLSMWLATLAKGKPLSFLDHHIRLGNSLVGTSLSAINETAVTLQEEERQRRARARQRQKAATTGQTELWSDADYSAGVQFAVQQMSAIEHTIANQVSDVKRQEQMYADLTRRLNAWKQAADVWTARYFGLQVTAEEWKAVRSLTSSGLLSPAVQKILDDAQQVARTQRFFHWELAFPEIFYDANGQAKEAPGFDAVVGNPPYVKYQNFSYALKQYLATGYKVYSGSADLYLYFFELGLRQVRGNCYVGFITSGTYMNSNSATPLREYIHENAALSAVVNFGENQPFRGAEMVYPTIAILRKSQPQLTFKSLFIDGVRKQGELANSIAAEMTDTLSDITSMEEWRFQPIAITNLFRKIITGRPPLQDAVNGQIYYGVLTGYNDAFYIDDETRKTLIQEHSSSEELIKPLVRGQDLRPWYNVKSGLYLIFARQGIDIESYPAIKRHLNQYLHRLEVRPADWDDKKQGKWEGRTSGSYKWFEWHDSVAYHREFEKPKIFYPDISKLPRYSWDHSGQYCDPTATIIVPNNISILALLNSRISWFVFSQIAIPLRLRGGLWQYRGKLQFIRRLPIPELTTEQESGLASIAEEITRLAKGRYKTHEDMRQTMRNEFGGGEIGSGVNLYRWWEYADESALSAAIQHQLGQEIPLRKRAEWRGFLSEQKAEHTRLTNEIIQQEIRLNSIVYDAFNLNAEERDLIERTTKYPYGEV